MALNTKLNLSDNKAYQASGQTLTLSGDTTIANSGTLSYEGSRIFTDNELVTKEYVDEQVISGVTGGTTYELGSPAAVEVGGIDVGTVLTGKTSNELFEEMLYPDLCGTLTAPSMTSLALVPSTSPLEIGTVLGSLSITANFSRGSINPQYDSASPNRSGAPISYCFTGDDIDDGIVVCTADAAVTGLTSYEIVAGANTWGSCTCHSIGVQPKSNKGTNYDSPLSAGVVGQASSTITGILPYFYGVSVSEPTANQALIDSGTCVVATSDGTINITYGSQTAKWLWFATPNASTTKQGWYEGPTNKGNIGIPSDLFDAPSTPSIDSPTALWSSETYKVYISTISTDTSANAYCMTNAAQQ